MNPHYATYDTYSVGPDLDPTAEPDQYWRAARTPAAASPPVLARIAWIEERPAARLRPVAPATPPASAPRGAAGENRFSPERQDTAHPRPERSQAVVREISSTAPNAKPAQSEETWPLSMGAALSAHAKWIVLLAVLAAAGLALVVMERDVTLNDANFSAPLGGPEFPSPAVAAAPVEPTYEEPLPPATSAAGPVGLARAAAPPAIQAIPETSPQATLDAAGLRPYDNAPQLATRPSAPLFNAPHTAEATAPGSTSTR